MRATIFYLGSLLLAPMLFAEPGQPLPSSESLSKCAKPLAESSKWTIPFTLTDPLHESSFYDSETNTLFLYSDPLSNMYVLANGKIFVVKPDLGPLQPNLVQERIFRIKELPSIPHSFRLIFAMGRMKIKPYPAAKGEENQVQAVLFPAREASPQESKEAEAKFLAAYESQWQQLPDRENPGWFTSLLNHVRGSKSPDKDLLSEARAHCSQIFSPKGDCKDNCRASVKSGPDLKGKLDFVSRPEEDRSNTNSSAR